MADELFSWDDIKADWTETKEILERCYREIPKVVRIRQKTCRDLLKEVEDSLVLLDQKETDYKLSEDVVKDRIGDEITAIARGAKLKAIEAESTINRYVPTEQDYRMGQGVVRALMFILLALSAAYVLHHIIDIENPRQIIEFRLWDEGIGKGLEIIYWSLFGVLANLMYAAALHLFNRDFDRWSIGWYMAKIPQAPLITLVVVMFLMHVPSVEVGGVDVTLGNASIHMIIVVSFIMGFFSRRTYKVLAAIRDKVFRSPEGEGGGDE